MLGHLLTEIAQLMKLSCQESLGINWIPEPTVLDSKSSLSVDQTPTIPLYLDIYLVICFFN